MLPYSLHDNVLTPDPTDYMAVVQDTKKCSISNIIDDITGEGSILKETECSAVLHAFFRALGKRLQNGEGFISEYLLLDRSISGVFTSRDDSFDPARHQINANLRLGSMLATMAEQTPVHKVPTVKKLPVLESVRDLKTKTFNDRITPGSFAEINGRELKIGDLNDPQQGVFFIDANGVETRVNEVSNNYPSKLTVEVPDGLNTGEYRLEVRTVRRTTKKLRRGNLNETLVVASTPTPLL